MNELLGIIELIVVFGGVLLSKKLFGKKGLFAWVVIAGILANLQVNKTITLFGLDVAMGNVMFASSFLATDMLSEIYGKKVAKKAVIAGVSALVFFVCFMQFTLSFTPSEYDVITPAMSEFFQMSVRTTVASVTMYALANICDVYLFDFLKKKTNGKKLWLRNNVSTIICNGLENFGFIFLAFYGVLENESLLPIALTTTAVEAVIALLDTPFLYIAKKTKTKGEE
jgi:uncharacterized integral membrane protein (TIGR00697 family)